MVNMASIRFHGVIRFFHSSRPADIVASDGRRIIQGSAECQKVMFKAQGPLSRASEILRDGRNVWVCVCYNMRRRLKAHT